MIFFIKDRILVKWYGTNILLSSFGCYPDAEQVYLQLFELANFINGGNVQYVDVHYSDWYKK